ncbi:MAG: tRNA (adenosine(37)-N6)-threonylcarbamoyltransferase complex transferase subunit TsaD [Patescibacteria group bacterium]|nr:tRNA (adenosine(37)-N6)-threonylcarbamoyltransferase complex transferase subunit TsaD [Patescibacteria group bacterium]
MIILSIETSCDETAVAIVKFNRGKVEVLSNIISSQANMHSKFGGVVPSLASRMHLKNMAPVLKRALRQAEKNCRRDADLSHLPRTRDKSRFYERIDYIAVTNGPGLIPALMIGVQTAKTLSYTLKKPLVGVHHIEGHIYANWLRSIYLNSKSNSLAGGQNYKLWKPKFPILCLTVSGGHTQIVLMKKDLNYRIIGETVDDAVGEAFDKVAKILGLDYPGGPLIEKMAKKGNKDKFKFTRPMINSKDHNFSFSGLKTAVLYNWKLENKKEKCRIGEKILKQVQNDRLQYKADIAASFQQAVIDVLISKTIKVAKQYKVKNVILGGGVSANKELQKQLRKTINKKIPNTEYQILNTKLSTDNALMIAIAGYYRIKNNKGIGDWKSVKADANLRLKLF